MSEIKKLLFSVSDKGNPMAQIWIDDSDITKNSDSIYIALKNQVAYLFFMGVGANIELKKSKQYYNVDVPEMFINLFDGYKVSTDGTIKMIGNMLNNAFNNAFNSIEFIKNGEVTKISQEEADEKCLEYMRGYQSLYATAINSLVDSKVGALKTVGKILTKEDSKTSDIKEANAILMQFTTLLSREVIARNNFMIETQQTVEELKEENKTKTK